LQGPAAQEAEIIIVVWCIFVFVIGILEDEKEGGQQKPLSMFFEEAIMTRLAPTLIL
jgi:hypothetical protein